jgi:hypothetical protein
MRRRRAVLQAQGEHNDKRRYADRMTVSTLIRQSQREPPSSLPPSFQPPLSMSSSSPTPFPSPSSRRPTIRPPPNRPTRIPHGTGDGDGDSDEEEKVKPQRPRRGKAQRSWMAADYCQQRRGGFSKAPKRRKPGKKGATSGSTDVLITGRVRAAAEQYYTTG